MKPCCKTNLALAALTLMVTPVWARPNIDTLANQCFTLGKPNACRELQKIAVEGKDPGLRAEAVVRLTDQSLLAKIAEEDKDSEVRRAAVNQLTDQSLLAKIAEGDKDRVVREAAINLLTDSLVLQRIAIREEDPEVATAAVGSHINDTSLVDVALGAVLPKARIQATGRIAEVRLLTRIAVESADAEVVRAALEKLSDPAAIAKVAADGKNTRTRVDVIRRLTDAALLAHIAATDPDGDIRGLAATLASGWKTAQNEREVYLWKPGQGTENGARSHWRIKAALRSARQAGAGAWEFQPEGQNDQCDLESGNLTLGFSGNKTSFQGPISFAGRNVDGEGAWIASDGKTYVILEPNFYVDKGGLMLSGSWRATTVQQGVTRTMMSTLDDSAVAVTGTIRFPQNRWTPSGAGLELNGGGIQFDETGVFLIPGTQYRPL
jgi:hypothetical protein